MTFPLLALYAVARARLISKDKRNSTTRCGRSLVNEKTANRTSQSVIDGPFDFVYSGFMLKHS